MASAHLPTLRRAWRLRELPDVDERRCTGCGRCVAVCPTECLAMDDRLPWLPRPEHCLSCGACVFLCPVAALSLTISDSPDR